LHNEAGVRRLATVLPPSPPDHCLKLIGHDRDTGVFRRAIQPPFTDKIGTSVARWTLGLRDQTAGNAEPGRLLKRPMKRT